jgi:hypothetical protein
LQKQILLELENCFTIFAFLSTDQNGQCIPKIRIASWTHLYLLGFHGEGEPSTMKLQVF